MIEVKAVDDIIFEQHLRGTAPQILGELTSINISVLKALNKEAGKGIPLSATIIAFAQSMIRGARENAEMIDGLNNIGKE